MKKCFLIVLLVLIGYSFSQGGTINVPADYSTIQAAVAAANNGDIINIANGTYTLTTTLNINHELTIIGQSEAGVIINTTAVGGWGINPNKSNTSLSYMTIIPNGISGGYAIHAGDNNVPVVIYNVALSHMTINGAKKTAFDFNGITNLNISYLTATNTISGNGVQVSGCTNVTISHINTSNNTWGGLAIYVGKLPPSSVGRGSDNVNIDGTTCSFSEANKIYNQDESGFFNTNITVTGFDFLVKNSTSMAGYSFYQIDKAAALTFAGALPSPSNSTVQQISTGEYWIGPYNLYLSPTTSAVAGTIYPNVSWGMPAVLPAGYPGAPVNDWKLTNPPTPNTLYIVPAVGSVFGACNLTLQWDNTQYNFGSLDQTGGMFAGGQFNYLMSTSGTTTQIVINASSLGSNITTATGNYIAKLNLIPKHPGNAPVSITATDFRTYDGTGGFNGVYMTPINTTVKSYLGDVASPLGVQSTGDGKVDINDLNAWSISYWSGVTGFSGGMTNYKVKYDVGPTSTGTVYGIPTMDGKIDFEDLVIFSISYGLSSNNVYPKIRPVSQEPVILSLGTAVQIGNETQIPLYIKGSVSDIRGMSLGFNGSFGKFLGVSNGELLKNFTTPVMLFSKSEGNSVNVDFAIMGLDAEGLNKEGEVVILRFEGMTGLTISGAEIRNSGNVHIESTTGVIKEAALPTSFGLNQNYPNPFNPSTTISYQLPKQSQVEISIFNALGQKVTTLVNEVKEVGYYTVTLNASNLSSGVYFYSIKSGDFSLTKKMLLMK